MALTEPSSLMLAANLPEEDGKSDSKPRRYFLKYPKSIELTEPLPSTSPKIMTSALN